MIRKGYIRSLKLNPNQVKSKLVFRPTAKGVIYSRAGLGVNTDAMIGAQLEKDELVKVREFLTKVPDPGRREHYRDTEAQMFLDYDLFDESGNLMFKDQKDYLKQGLRILLFEQTTDKRFDIEDLFRFRFEERKVAHPTELRLLRDILCKIRQNIDEAIT